MKYWLYGFAAVMAIALGVRAWLPVAQQESHHADPYDQPGEAIEYYLSKRLPAGHGDLPVERYYRAMDRMSGMPVYSTKARRFVPVTLDPKTGRSRSLSLGQWTSLGPGNIGGRTRTLVIHPDSPHILYAAGVSGGIWKSTSEGASWAPLDDMLPNLAVSTLAMDPFQPDTIYAGTGEGFGNVGSVRGAGILRTTDGGQSWTLLESTRQNSNFYFVNKIVISRKDTKRIYAATGTGVWRSLDGGQRWEQSLDRTNLALGCQDLAIRTDLEEDVLFASCRANPQGAIWRNRNANGDGQWEHVFTISFMNRTSLAIAPSRQGTIYALIASSEPGTCPTNPGPHPPGPCYRDGMLGVYRSLENGEPGSWEPRTRNTDENRLNTVLLSNPLLFFRDVCSGGTKSFSSQGWYDNVIAVDPLNPERVWAGGIDTFRSEDGGVNWGIASYWWAPGAAQYAHADHHAIVFHPLYDGNENQVVYVTNDGGIQRTENALAAVATGPQAACNPSNGSVRWTELNNNLGVTQFYHGSAYPGGHLYFGGTQDNGTLRGADADGHDGWREIQGGDGGYTAIHPADPRILYASLTRLSLRKSLDGRTFRSVTSGITESSANFSFITPFVMDPGDPERLWIGGRSLWRTSNGASSWTRASPELPASAITAIAVSPADPNRVLVGNREGFIYRSHEALTANEETVWRPARPRTGNVSWIAFDPADPNVAYATYSTFNSANDNHVYRTDDGGVNWRPLDGSGDRAIPDIPVHAILPDPHNPRTLYIGTDLGVFVSLDAGESWAKEDSGFPHTTVESLSILRTGEGAFLHAFTHGRGAWRVWLGPGEPCRYSIGTERIEAPVAGGTFTIEVGAGAGCRWSGLSNVSWLTFEGPPMGEGSGNMRVRVSAILSGGRETRLLVADKAIVITQSVPN
jgi:photosystem II stability/assembly factor-like uncharacterized protein